MLAALPNQRLITGGWLLLLDLIWVVHQNVACEVLSDETALSSRSGAVWYRNVAWTAVSDRELPAGRWQVGLRGKRRIPGLSGWL